MDARTVIALLRARAVLASRDRWTREELLAYQSHALAELRALALARSPFYREFHRGLDAAPLESLPVLTKATLMERFDDLVTDRDVRLSEVEAHLTSTGSTDLLAQPTDGVVDADVATSVRVALRQAGADNVRVRVERVETIPRTPLGKAPLVRAIRGEHAEGASTATQSSFMSS